MVASKRGGKVRRKMTQLNRVVASPSKEMAIGERAPKKKKTKTLAVAASRLAGRCFSCRLPHCTGDVDVVSSRSAEKENGAGKRKNEVRRRSRRAAAFTQGKPSSSSPVPLLDNKTTKNQVRCSPHLLTLMLHCLSIRARIWSIVNLLGCERREEKRGVRGGKRGRREGEIGRRKKEIDRRPYSFARDVGFVVRSFAPRAVIQLTEEAHVHTHLTMVAEFLLEVARGPP